MQACTCMDVQESQGNWPEMRKTLGKPGFCSTGFRKLTERTGTELLGVLHVFFGSSRGTRMVFSEAIPFVTDCMTRLLDPRRTKRVAPILTSGYPGTFGNLRSRRRSLTQSRHGSRLQTGILWRTCTVIHSDIIEVRRRRNNV